MPHMTMSRMISSIVVLVAVVLSASTASAVNIPPDHLDPFSLPCVINITEMGSSRLIVWDSVTGASSYKIGYRRCDGTIVGLAEVMDTSYVHIHENTDECLEYVMVAYDSNGVRVCSAHVTGVGADCPCP